MLISRWRKLKSNNVRSLAEIAARVTEVLADLILMAAPDDRLTLMADASQTSEGWCWKGVKSPNRPTRAGGLKTDPDSA
jgi:hypothetical protein